MVPLPLAGDRSTTGPDSAHSLAGVAAEVPAMGRPVVGLIHPGEMGAAIGHALVKRGVDVGWASEGRGADTAGRADAAGLVDAGDVAGLARRSDILLSVCPPHAAGQVARQVASAGFDGIFVDANAVAPATVRRMAGVLPAGTRLVDGGIVGPPPSRAGQTRLYLSGDAAETVGALFSGTEVEVRILAGGVGAASAVKMAFAAWTKGSAALLLAAHELATAEDVAEALVAEWATSLPGLADRHAAATRSARAKGWRWRGEMAEIAAAMRAHGLPDGFHVAAEEMYRRAAPDS
jgi:3-hydroxyisobutyrate dehydrogenase-like beta-hydroxyacid dehydrogenase